MSEISEIELKTMTKEQCYMRGYKDGKSDVLDNPRAEIAENGNSDINTQTVLSIIDHYREGERK